MYVASVNQNMITCSYLFINKLIRLYDKYIVLFGYVVNSWLLFLVLTKTSLKIFINLSCFIFLTVCKVNYLLISAEKAYSSSDMQLYQRNHQGFAWNE